MKRICIVEENKNKRKILSNLPAGCEEGFVSGMYSEHADFGMKLGICSEEGKLLLVPQYDVITVQWYGRYVEFECEEWVGEECFERVFVLTKGGEIVDKRWYKEEE